MDHCSLSLHVVVLIVLFCENTSLKKLHSLSWCQVCFVKQHLGKGQFFEEVFTYM